MIDITLFRRQELRPTRWSGGETTQLCIYPREADYEKRNFAFRISTATVDVEQSDFTPLPGFTRLIMPLEGELRLEHRDHHAVLLKPFRQDRFQGGWETRSYGKCTDFNLMLAAGWAGRMEAVSQPEIAIAEGFTGIYALVGGLRLSQPDGSDCLLEAGDFLMARCPLGESGVLRCSGTEPGRVFAALAAAHERELS